MIVLGEKDTRSSITFLQMESIHNRVMHTVKNPVFTYIY